MTNELWSPDIIGFWVSQSLSQSFIFVTKLGLKTQTLWHFLNSVTTLNFVTVFGNLKFVSQSLANSVTTQTLWQLCYTTLWQLSTFLTVIFERSAGHFSDDFEIESVQFVRLTFSYQTDIFIRAVFRLPDKVPRLCVRTHAINIKFFHPISLQFSQLVYPLAALIYDTSDFHMIVNSASWIGLRLM